MHSAKAAILGLLIFGSLLSGCASVSNCLKRGPVLPDSSTQVTNTADAREAVGLLRDNHSFPFASIEDVEITKNTITVKGYKSTEHTSEMTSIMYPPGSKLTQAMVESYGFYTLTETRNQIAIWLKDIKALTLERVQGFIPNEEATGSSDDPKPMLLVSDGVVCRIHLADKQVVSFYSPSESYIKRVAAGFAFLAEKPITEETHFNKVGVVIGERGEIAQVKLGSPADIAGLPLGKTMDAIDGVSTAGDISDQAKYDKMGPGKHTVEIRKFALAFEGLRSFDLYVPAEGN